MKRAPPAAVGARPIVAFEELGKLCSLPVVVEKVGGSRGEGLAWAHLCCTMPPCATRLCSCRRSAADEHAVGELACKALDPTNPATQVKQLMRAGGTRRDAAAMHHIHANRMAAGTGGSSWHHDYEQAPNRRTRPFAAIYCHLLPLRLLAPVDRALL